MEPNKLNKVTKPLGAKSYGHICHLPGSRLGPGDHKLEPGQDRILTQKGRDRHDVIIVQEKLDGSNVCVARVNGELVPLGRAGYPSISSNYEQHRLFAGWVFERLDRFDFLREGERLCGEWLAQAHGTRYALSHDPFVPFDLMRGLERAPFAEFNERVPAAGFTLPKLLSQGPPISVEAVLKILEGEERTRNGFHGAIDPVAGCRRLPRQVRPPGKNRRLLSAGDQQGRGRVELAAAEVTVGHWMDFERTI
jgi:hypothetical protein